MAEVLSTELKSDLENLYKITGDLLNLLQNKDLSKENKEVRELLDIMRFRLEDMGGTLQKDIYNCDYLITKFETMDV